MCLQQLLDSIVKSLHVSFRVNNQRSLNQKTKLKACNHNKIGIYESKYMMQYMIYDATHP